MERTFVGEFSREEILAWIDQTLEANGDRKPIGIAVSNNLHTNYGIAGEHRGVKIAMDPDLYPDDTVRIRFE